MKKIGVLLSLFLCNIVSLHATPLKRRLANLESNVSYLARNESKAWREIAYLNNEVSHLEKKVYKKLGKSLGKLKCHANESKEDKYYDRDLPNDND
jgi:hypothetical protein